ncbi:MAG: hypothetical protein KAI47_26710, partial [Deltaproteobacteria bacterium]|nr:hypothetical protein [Deltaproteobacteria bacterium]
MTRRPRKNRPLPAQPQGCCLFFAFFIALAGATGCSDDGGPAETQAPLAATCNPLEREHCFLPWPSSFYLKKDAKTATGFRLNYGADALPANKEGVHVSPARYNLRDGFSIGSQPIVWLPGGISTDSLATLDDPAPSIKADHPIWLISMADKKRVAFFAELDENAAGTKLKQALILRPLHPL